MRVEQNGLHCRLFNRVPKEKLPQILVHVIDQMALQSVEIFSAVEVEQLVDMLHLTAGEVHQLVDAATTIFHDAAIFGHINTDALVAQGCHPDVALVVEKAWRKKGRSMAAELLSFRSVEPAVTLKQSQWRLQLNMSQRSLAGQSNPVAVIQLELQANEANTNKQGLVDIEMNHSELYSFFGLLNQIQSELDSLAV